MSQAPTRDPEPDPHPTCIGCDGDRPAIVAVVHADGHPVPYCEACAETHVHEGGREFPLDEFYHLVDGPETVTRVPTPRYAEICESAGDGGSPDAWLEAKNPAGEKEGFVRLSDWQ